MIGRHCADHTATNWLAGCSPWVSPEHDLHENMTDRLLYDRTSIHWTPSTLNSIHTHWQWWRWVIQSFVNLESCTHRLIMHQLSFFPSIFSPLRLTFSCFHLHLQFRRWFCTGRVYPKRPQDTVDGRHLSGDLLVFFVRAHLQERRCTALQIKSVLSQKLWKALNWN